MKRTDEAAGTVSKKTNQELKGQKKLTADEYAELKDGMQNFTLDDDEMDTFMESGNLDALCQEGGDDLTRYYEEGQNENDEDDEDDQPPSQSQKSVRSAGLNSNTNMSAMVRRLLKARGVEIPEDSEQKPPNDGKGDNEGGKGGKGKGKRQQQRKEGQRKIDLENPTASIATSEQGQNKLKMIMEMLDNQDTSIGRELATAKKMKYKPAPNMIQDANNAQQELQAKHKEVKGLIMKQTKHLNTIKKTMKERAESKQ